VGITSHDVIHHLRKVTGIKRIGHAGTLDPLASGVLVVALGRESTKLINQEVVKDKVYLARVTLGFTSLTDDAEGPLTPLPSTVIPTQSDVERVLQTFIGTILQQPPIFSAVKIHGHTAHSLARKHHSVILGPRTVTLYEFSKLNYKYPVLSFRVHVGSGFYIRSLARDIGNQLGTGGYLSQLVRLSVGSYLLKEAIPLGRFVVYWQKYLAAHPTLQSGNLANPS
jgi:tRNA pseudouridine55 synthase